MNTDTMPFVETVLGRIPATDLGITLPHEHFFCSTAGPNLAELSRRTGLHIVMGCGHYWEASHPPDMAAIAQSAITERIVAEFRDAAEGTGIRCRGCACAASRKRKSTRLRFTIPAG